MKRQGITMITRDGIVGSRDHDGIRPACYGVRKTEEGEEYMIASESVALNVLGFELINDILPGEAVCIQTNGEVSVKQCATHTTYSPCIFEQVYLARPDSIIDHVSVYKSRLKMGEKLADKILREHPNHDIDVVIPIPDTSCTAALPMAHRLDVKYRDGLVKNRYIGRTFIMPGQQQRLKSVRQKFNTVELEFRGKNVLLVDDSIVRGTTTKQLVQMAKEAGAKKVYLASAAPPVRFCVWAETTVSSRCKRSPANRPRVATAPLRRNSWLPTWLSARSVFRLCLHGIRSSIGRLCAYSTKTTQQ